MSRPNSILLNVMGDQAWGVAGFADAMNSKRPVSDYKAGYTFHAYGEWFKIMREPYNPLFATHPSTEAYPAKESTDGK